jgi:hypothetical protein
MPGRREGISGAQRVQSNCSHDVWKALVESARLHGMQYADPFRSPQSVHAKLRCSSRALPPLRLKLRAVIADPIQRILERLGHKRHIDYTSTHTVTSSGSQARRVHFIFEKSPYLKFASTLHRHVHHASNLSATPTPQLTSLLASPAPCLATIVPLHQRRRRKYGSTPRSGWQS